MGMAEPREEPGTETQYANEPNFEVSPHKIFKKKEEFVILKGMLFSIQSVSPRKVILKHRGTLKVKISDGVYLIDKTNGASD